MEKPEKISKKETFLYYNTLAGLVKSLEGYCTVIDLRNESSIYGKILSVDGFMNIEMEDTIFCDARGNKYPFKVFFIRGRIIRYVHIPRNLNAVELYKKQLRKMQRPTRRPEKPKCVFKIRRAEKYHQEILKELGEQKLT